jgi:hypothetical protein
LLPVAEKWASFDAFNDFGYLTAPSSEPWPFDIITPGFTDYDYTLPAVENQLNIPIRPDVQNDFLTHLAPSGIFAEPSGQPAPTVTLSAAQEERFSCTTEGCNKTFGRAGDWRRHMGKHTSPKFKCIMIDCDKTFYRKDKLKAHVRQGHKMDL